MNKFKLVLVLLVIATSCLPVVVNTPPVRRPPAQMQPTQNTALYDLSIPANVLTLRSNFLQLVNELRKPYGKQALVWNDKLNAMAEFWAETHKAKRLYMTHEHNGITLASRANQESYTYFDIAENITRAFHPDAKMIFELWRNSEGHRKNMLGPATEVGLACISSDYGVVDTPKYVCVAVFGRPTPP